MAVVPVNLVIPDAPIIGGIPCGPGLVPFDHVSETLADFITKHPDRTRYFQVKGSSMAGINILEGDVLAFDELEQPRHGSIVAVMSEGGTMTVKRYEPLSDPPGLYGYGLDRKRTHIEMNEALIVGVLVCFSRQWSDDLFQWEGP